MLRASPPESLTGREHGPIAPATTGRRACLDMSCWVSSPRWVTEPPALPSASGCSDRPTGPQRLAGRVRRGGVPQPRSASGGRRPHRGRRTADLRADRMAGPVRPRPPRDRPDLTVGMRRGKHPRTGRSRAAREHRPTCAPCPSRARSSSHPGRLTATQGHASFPLTCGLGDEPGRADDLLSGRSGIIWLSARSRPCDALLVPTTGAAGAPEAHSRTGGSKCLASLDALRGGFT